MNSILVSGIVGLVSATLVAVVSHWTLLHRIKKEAAQKNRSEYFQKQLAAYMKLWGLLPPTSSYITPDTIISKNVTPYEINVQNAKIFCTDITSFFFSEQGIFLSKNVRSSIFKLRDFIDALINNDASKNLHTITLSNNKYNDLIFHFKQMQIAVRNDIGLRNLLFDEDEIVIKRK
jgi:hypothetical protein